MALVVITSLYTRANEHWDERFARLKGAKMGENVRHRIFVTMGMTWAMLYLACPSSFGQAQRAAESSRPDPQGAIEASVDRFVAAYNAHDAAAVAALFAPEAQMIDDEDQTIQGREAIEQTYAEVFAAAPESTIEVNVQSIRPIGTALVVETGSTRTLSSPDAPPELGRYTALHVLREGQWMMALVRDAAAEPSHRDHLQALGWLVGDWIDESRAGVVKTSCRWSDDGNFLLQDITVHRSGQELMQVQQRIGWDPLTKRFKAWMFDSQGGYGESLWTPTDEGWLMRATSVLTDGSLASSTNYVEPVGTDRYVFRSVDRVAGDEVLPPVEVVIVRQPPQPQ
jgi:uncharacterized protein (TIGR02246 family)